MNENGNSFVWLDRRMTLGNWIQIGGLVVFAIVGWVRFEGGLASAQDDIDRHETLLETKASNADVARIDTRLGNVEAASNDQRERMIRVELQLQHQNELLQGIAETVGARRVRPQDR